MMFKDPLRSSQDKKFTIQTKVLGRGNFSEVRLAINKKTKCRVAAKVVDLLQFYKEFKREVEMLQKLNHPNIISSYGSEIRRDGRGVLYLEYLQHPTLQDYLKIHKHLTEPVAIKVFTQLVSAVEHMHMKGISHHDIKPENISFDPETHNIKLFDFGLAVGLDLSLPPYTSWDAGSPLYMAPEVLLCDEHNPFIADAWSLGTLLYELIVGKTPFWQCKTVEDLGKLWATRISITIPQEVPCSPKIRKICSRLLSYTPENRLTIPELKKALSPKPKPKRLLHRNRNLSSSVPTAIPTPSRSRSKSLQSRADEMVKSLKHTSLPKTLATIVEHIHT